MAISNNSTGLRTGVCTSTTRPTAPYEGQTIFETDTKNMLIYSSNAWVCITPQSATNATFASTTSTTYVDIASAVPSVSLMTGTTALVTVGFTGYNVESYLAMMSFAVSGASSIAASDAMTAIVRYGGQISATTTKKITGLTAGLNIFTGKYRSSTVGTTAAFDSRYITVVGLP